MLSLTLAPHPVLGIGITSPGVIDDAGTVLQAPNRQWSDLPLAQILTDELGVPAHVANDANAAALGEFTFGGATGSGLLTISVGDGVGAGVILDGSLVLGHGAVGEIGHLIALDDRDTDAVLGRPQRCACGRLGCLETILSVPALRRRVGGLDPAAAEAVLDAVGHRLGLALAPVVSMLNLAEIVLSGPADLLGGPLRDAAQATIRERTLPYVSRDLQIRMTTLGEDGALAGAAVLVLSGRLGVS
ncbi:ROK family protein [Georgenia yuyongxinii]